MYPWALFLKTLCIFSKNKLNNWTKYFEFRYLRRHRRDAKNDDNINNFDYDAYAIYSSAARGDKDWVEDHLVANLERARDNDRFQFCIRQRDVGAGGFEYEKWANYMVRKNLKFGAI